jgi:ribosomal protein L13
MLGGGTTTGMILPEIQIGDRVVVAPVGDLAYMLMVARHEQAIKSWMSFFVEGRVLGRLGTNVSSLLTQGVNASVGLNMGWSVKILEDDRWAVATGLVLKTGTYTTIDVRKWAEGLVRDSGVVTATNPLIDTRPSMKLNLNVRGAYTFNETFGLMGFVNGGYSEPLTRDGAYEAVFDGGLALSMNWDPVVDVPIGTSIGADYRQIPETATQDQGATKNVYLRIGYTGTDAYGLGLQFNGQFAPIAGIEHQVTFVSALLDFRFYF